MAAGTRGGGGAAAAPRWRRETHGSGKGAWAGGVLVTQGGTSGGIFDRRHQAPGTSNLGGPEVYVIMLAHIAAADGQCVQTLTGHGSFVNSAVFSPDGTQVLTASSDNFPIPLSPYGLQPPTRIVRNVPDWARS